MHLGEKKGLICVDCRSKYVRKDHYEKHRRKCRKEVIAADTETQEEVVVSVPATITSLTINQNVSKDQHNICNECSYSTYLVQHLSRHKISHTKQQNFECKMCPRKFKREGCLLHHMSGDHKNNSSVAGNKKFYSHNNFNPERINNIFILEMTEDDNDLNEGPSTQESSTCLAESGN